MFDFNRSFREKYDLAKAYSRNDKFSEFKAAIGNLKDLPLSFDQLALVNSLEREGFRSHSELTISSALEFLANGEEGVARSKLSGLLVHPLYDDCPEVKKEVDKIILVLNQL